MLALLLALAGAAVVWRAPAARAAGFLVNSPQDQIDANPGDGICETADPGECTLRAAVQETNALLGPDTITLPAGTYDLTIPGAREAVSETGDLDLLDPVTLTGAGAASTVIDGQDLDRVIEVVAVATIEGVTIRNGGNVATGAGLNVNRAGGELTLKKSVVEDNVATNWGGGIYAAGPLTAEDVEIRDNTATTSFGGGLFVDFEPPLSVTRTTIAGNYAGTQGGGAWMALSDSPESTFTNVTWSGNSADRNGGAIRLYSGTLELLNNTVVNNQARGAAGAGLSRSLGFFQLQNTILDNTFAGVADNCQGPSSAFVSEGHNLEDGNTCGLSDDEANPDATDGDWIDTDPNLGPLADHGGEVRVHPLLAGSVALDAGDDVDCPPTDARGAARPADSGDEGTTATCDIGAYEYVDADQDGVEWGADPNDANTCVPQSTDPTCDSDEDTIVNGDDDCDNVPEDFDGFEDADGCPDADNDGDGVLDAQDAAPNNPCVPSVAHAECDFDNDGQKNSADLDDDGDDQSDEDEDACGSDPVDATDKSSDLDGDDEPDCVDADRDGDGIANDEDEFPDDATESTDTDGDGIGDNADGCDDEAEDPDGIEDADGCPETDADEDGVDDELDEFPTDENESNDADDDGTGDNADPDDDNDGVLDTVDLCPVDPEDEDGKQDSDGCRDESVKTTVSASYAARRDKVKGSVSAPDASCLPDRKVTLFKRRPGPDAKIGSPVWTNEEGRYGAPAQGATGVLYVRVARKVLEPNDGDVVVTCSAAKSPLVRAG